MKTNRGFKKLTKVEKTCVYRAMELIERGMCYRSCFALECSFGRSRMDNLVTAYESLFARMPYGSWLIYDELAKGLTREELKQWRLTMLAWFAEVGRLSDT